MKRALCLGVLLDALNVLAVDGFEIFLSLVMKAIVHWEVAGAYVGMRYGKYWYPSWLLFRGFFSESVAVLGLIDEMFAVAAAAEVFAENIEELAHDLGIAREGMLLPMLMLDCLGQERGRMLVARVRDGAGDFEWWTAACRKMLV